jgi:hypothetical protein
VEVKESDTEGLLSYKKWQDTFMALYICACHSWLACLMLFINRFLSFFVDSGNLAPSESKAKAMKGIRIRQTSDSDGQ